MKNSQIRLKPEGTISHRLLKLTAGYVFFGIGFLGMFLPVLPTTVFWIISAICFAKSSPSMYRRILSWPRIGNAIGDFVNHGVVRPASKRIALGGMAASALLMILLNVEPGVASAALVGLSIAAAYVMTRPGGVATASVIAEQE